MAEVGLILLLSLSSQGPLRQLQLPKFQDKCHFFNSSKNETQSYLKSLESKAPDSQANNLFTILRRPNWTANTMLDMVCWPLSSLLHPALSREADFHRSARLPWRQASSWTLWESRRKDQKMGEARGLAPCPWGTFLHQGPQHLSRGSPGVTARAAAMARSRHWQPLPALTLQTSWGQWHTGCEHKDAYVTFLWLPQCYLENGWLKTMKLIFSVAEARIWNQGASWLIFQRL